MSQSNCYFLSCVQVSQETGKVVWYSHLFPRISHHFVIHTVIGASIVNEAEVDVFLKLLCLLHDPLNIGNLIPNSSTSSEPRLYIWKFSVHVLLKRSLKDFESNFANMWNEQNCMVIWTFFDIILLCDCNESWPFPVLWPLLQSVQFSSVAQSCPTLCDPVETEECQASLSITNSQSPLKLMSTESVMPSNLLILCHPLLLLPSIFSSIRVFSNESALCSGQSIEVSASTSVLPMNIQDWFPLGWIGYFSKFAGILSAAL